MRNNRKNSPDIVFIIDDEKDLLALLHEAFEEEGVCVHTFGSSQELEDFLEQESNLQELGQVKAIITDGNLGFGSSGQDLLKWAAEKIPRKPLRYLMTGDVMAFEDSQQNEGLKDPQVERVFFKPFDPFDLASIVRADVQSLTKDLERI